MSQTKSPKLSGYLEAAEELRQNDRQWAAYESEGNCIVLAGPGSGKTKVLTAKLARMLAEDVAPPRGIVCMTYSSECARELNRRLGRLEVRSHRNLFVGTVHSFCLKSIVLPYARLAGIAIPDPVRVAANSEKGKAFDTALATAMSADENPTRWRTRCEAYRRTILDRNTPTWRGLDGDAARVIENYERLLRDGGSIDFDDMMLIGLRLVEGFEWVRKAIRSRYPIVVIDEYQDLGVPLHRLVLALCFDENEPNARLFAVGDPDQSIYGFTGAQPELLRQLSESIEVEAVRLQLNYRSRSEIVAGGEAALGEKRDYKAAGGDGGVIEFHKCPNGLKEQAKNICEKLIPSVLESGAAKSLGDIAVLYSTKDIGNDIAAAATDSSFSFIRVDQNAAYPKTPLTRWLEDCAAWCAGGWTEGDPPLSDILSRWQGFNQHLTTSSAQQVSRRKVVRFLFDHRNCETGLHDWLNDIESIAVGEMLKADSQSQDDRDVFARMKESSAKNGPMGLWTVGTFGGQGGSPNHLNLLTLHSSKGLEFDVVFMLGMDEGIEPPFWIKAEEGISERRRLFFVGFTRARNEVHMMYSGWTQTKNGYRHNNGPSRFLIELSQRLKEIRERAKS